LRWSATRAAQFGHPAVLGAVGLAAGVDNGIVLVHGKQAFAAPARAEHHEGIGCRRRPEPFVGHVAFGDLGGAAGEGAQLARGHRGHVAGIDLLADQRLGHQRQARPHLAQGIGCLGLLDGIAQRNGILGPLAEEIAGGHRPDDVASRIGGRQMAIAAPRHAADGPVEEGIGGHRLERPRGRLAGCALQAAGRIGVNDPQQVALGDDAP